MQSVLLASSFLSYGTRYFYRHPTRFRELVERYRGFQRRLNVLSALSGQTIDRVKGLFDELNSGDSFFAETGGFWQMPMYAIVEYIHIRLMQPDIVVETGVENGLSSRVILYAMERNGRGVLHSIDLPNADVEDKASGFRQRSIMPPGRETGWLVPASLRSRWHLHLGDAKELLPKLLQSLGTIDIFIHDSLHSYDHMILEFRTAWPYLRGGGLILSDDINANRAFDNISAEMNCRGVIFNDRNVGAIRKPGQSAMIEKSKSLRGATPKTQM